MKKINRERLPFIIHAAEKRAERRSRLKPNNSSKKRSPRRRLRRDHEYNQIVAPSKLDLYSPKNHNAFFDFLSELRQSVKYFKKTVITFRDSYRITASAGLMLIAETDRLVKAFPESTIRCTFRSGTSEGIYKNNVKTVEASLNQIGLFKIIGQQNQTRMNQPGINMWRQLSGDTADGSLANSLLKSLSDDMSEISRKKIYRGAIEAIANCVEHAYPSPRKDGLNVLDTRWWMLVGKDEANLCIIVCDLGVGIPETLPKKHPHKLLDTIRNTFKIFGSSDSEMIRASTHLKQTRTKLSNRGKGSKDFRSITRNFPTATLIIRSNKGAFFITGDEAKPLKSASRRRFVPDTMNRESILEHGKSIHGTLIEWIVPLQDLEK